MYAAPPEPSADFAESMAPIPATPVGHSVQASNGPVLDADQATVMPVPSEQRPRLIYTAQLGLTVDHGQTVTTLDRLLATTLDQGGYLSTRDERQLVVRIPSGNFHAIYASFEQLGDVSARQVQVQDVSEEFHDLEVRIESLTALIARMRALLERTTSLDEILRIESELGRLVGEIDQARGRLRFLGSRVAWSTVTITLSERPAPTPDAQPATPAAPRPLQMPIDWLNQTGLAPLLTLEN